MLRKLIKRLSAGKSAATDLGLPVSKTADQLIADGYRAEKEGLLQEACDRYRQAVKIDPSYPAAYLNLGAGLEAIGGREEALKCYKAALAIDPDNVFASYNLGNLLYTKAEYEQAERYLCFALERKPEFPEASVVLSNLYDAQGKFDAAAACLETALKLRPDYAGAWYNYALILAKLDRPKEVEVAAQRVLQIDPRFLPAYRLLGHLLQKEARLDEAIAVFGKASALPGNDIEFEQAELQVLNYSDGISDEDLLAKHKAVGARLESVNPARFVSRRTPSLPPRRLRIGYVSRDYFRHPVALFLIPVLERHDRSQFEVYCYSTGSKIDVITAQVQSLADVWTDGSKMSASELADKINQDGIDILIDLRGHAGSSDLAVFAQQPSPVQVTWLGYLSTTGLTRIQYRLSDAYSDPIGIADRFHTETLVRLPHSQWCYRPFLTLDSSDKPPCKQNGFITFGSANHALKLSRTTRMLWSSILMQLPGSRLVILGVPDGPVRGDLLGDFEKAGIAVSRITMVPPLPLDEYFSWFDAMDLALDSTPYSGGTTTCDTLWMGVPVVTHCGSRSVSRSAASILSTLGLTDWIAQTPDEYVNCALKFARDEGLLTELRVSLRQRMRMSPLMDESRFVSDLEHAYRDMWRKWCDEEHQ